MKHQRQLRGRRGDRLITPDAAPVQIECDFAAAPLDRLAITMERKWGIDRLPELVSVETARKYGAAIGQLNAAIQADDAELVAHKAQVCIRGLKAMDAEAERLGAAPASGKYIEGEYDGLKFGVLLDEKEWQAARDERPDLKFVSLREVGVALKMKLETPLVAETLKHFPDAKVTGYSTPTGELIEDEIPW